MLIKTIESSNASGWDDFVYQHKFGTFYHLSSWMEVIEKTYGYVPMYYVLEDEGNNLISGIPVFLIENKLMGNRLVSLPFTTACDPLIHSTEEFSLISARILEDMRRYTAKYIEIRALKNNSCLEFTNFTRLDYFKHHVLALSNDLGKLRKSFHKSCIQRAIKKAEKSDLTIRMGNSVNDMRNFYKLQVITRKKHGMPPQPYSYFRNMWKILYPKGFLSLLLADFNGKTVAGIIVIKWKKTAYYQNGASDRNYLYLRPNHLLLWKAIEDSCRQGFEYFDFGRSSARDEGLIMFKKRWATTQTELPYFYYPKVKGATSGVRDRLKYKIVTATCRKLPTFFLQKLGELAYKYLA